jgi:Fic family protein
MRRLLTQLREEKAIKLKGGLYHYTQSNFAYNSNRIEGSRLSEEQTRYIYETNTVNTSSDETADVDDIIETVNHFACFDYMLATADECLSEEMIKEYHRLIKRSTSSERLEWYKIGEYKSRPNTVGGSKTAPPSKVGAEMEKLLTAYRSKDKITLDDIIGFHYRFESIHPFQDGNGRVGRIIMFKECLKHDIMPFIIGNEHKMFYYRGLKEYKAERGYLTDTCLSAQDAYEATVAYFNE